MVLSSSKFEEIWSAVLSQLNDYIDDKIDSCDFHLVKDELDENKFYIMENGFILGVQMNLGSISK